MVTAPRTASNPLATPLTVTHHGLEVDQTGSYSNVANINATAAGGSFNIIQRSR